MGHAELQLMKSIRVAASERGHRLFRVNIGQAWCGKSQWSSEFNQRVLTHLRPFKTGLDRGWPDLLGWFIHQISPSPPIFMGIECKTGNLKLSKDQIRIKKMFEMHGCIHGVCYSVEDFLSVLRKANQKYACKSKFPTEPP